MTQIQPPVIMPEGTPPMAIKYARRPAWVVCETDAGVIFAQHRALSDGSFAPARYWDHAAGRWDSMFDPARHVRKLSRALGLVAGSLQCFAVPLAVAADPGASATVCRLADDGSIKSVVWIAGSAMLASESIADGTINA